MCVCVCCEVSFSDAYRPLSTIRERERERERERDRGFEAERSKERLCVYNLALRIGGLDCVCGVKRGERVFSPCPLYFVQSENKKKLVKKLVRLSSFSPRKEKKNRVRGITCSTTRFKP